MKTRLTSDQKLARAIRASELANQKAIRESIERQRSEKAAGYELRIEYQIPDLANATQIQRQAAQYGARYRGPLLTRSMVMFCLKEAKQHIKRMEKDPQVVNPRIIETMHGKPIKATWSPL